MSQRSLSSKQIVQIVRRHRKMVAAVTVAGLLIGAAYSVLLPPLKTSTALVVLVGKTPQTATEIVIARSEPVLSHALPAIQPSMSLQTLKNQLNVQSPATAIISVSAQAKSTDQANSAANAVAKSYIAYVRNPKSPAGHITAQLLQPATPATASGAITRDAVDGALGALAGLVLGTVTALIMRRRSGRLFALDDMANSIGVPVLTTVAVAHPTDAPGWARLLDDYKPGPVDAWRLRQSLLELGVAGPTGHAQHPVSVTMVSLPGDPGGLALGPQLASFAASLEIPTVLVVDAQQDSNATAALYTACTAPDGPGQRSRYLRTVACGAVDAAVPPAANLVVVVAVAEGEKPRIPGTMPTAGAVLGVSAGAATREQLARLAMAATAHGSELTGIFVADPDPADRTNGRFPRLPKQGRRTPASGIPALVPEPAPQGDTRAARDKNARLDFSARTTGPMEIS